MAAHLQGSPSQPQQQGESVTAIAKTLNVSRATLYRALADTE
ncbi:helix-turn-helix domain-containing protein [Streptomyces sp. NPDC057062]